MLSSAAIPKLNPHFRFQWEPAQNAHVLLYPEGMVRLNGSAGEILAICSGERDVQAIVATLSTKFPEAEDIEADIVQFLQEAHGKQWIYFDDEC